MPPRLLLARIHSLLRRLDGHRRDGAVLVAGALRIDPARREAWVGGAPLALTDSEFDLLQLLARHAGEVVSRDALMREIRGLEYDGLDRSIDNRVSRLRRKLPDDGLRIKTVRGRGYLLVTDG